MFVINQLYLGILVHDAVTSTVGAEINIAISNGAKAWNTIHLPFECVTFALRY